MNSCSAIPTEFVPSVFIKELSCFFLACSLALPEIDVSA